MAKYKIAWMPGDGVGHDVMEAARLVLDRLKLDAEYVPCDIGWEFWCKEGNALPDRTVKVPEGNDLRPVRRDHQQTAGQSQTGTGSGTSGQGPGLFLSHRGPPPDVQPPHEHAAVQKLSRQSAELSRHKDHEPERRRRPDRSGRVPGKHRRHVRRRRVFPVA